MGREGEQSLGTLASSQSGDPLLLLITASGLAQGLPGKQV